MGALKLCTSPGARERSHHGSRVEILLVACVVVAGCLSLAQAVHEIRIPYQIDSGEGVVLGGASAITHGQPLYPPANQFPYKMRVYGPLAYTLVAVPIKLAGMNFLWPRLLVLVCALVIALCIAALLQQWTGSWRVGFVFGIGYLALPITRPWLYVLRVDFVGLAFTLAGLLVVVQNRRRWAWSTLLFAAAMFCKLTLIAAPAAVFVWLLGENPGRALKFFLLLSAMCAGVFLGLQKVSGGWCMFHMFRTHADRYLVKQFVLLGGLVIVSASMMVVFAIKHVVGDFRQKHFSLPTIYLLASLLSSVSAGKLGATTNHFLEFLAAACIAGGLGYCEMKRQATRYYPLLAFGLAAAVIVGAVLQTRPSTWPDVDLSQCADAYRAIKNIRGEHVFSENVGALLMTGKPVLISDPFPYTQLVQNAGWPDDQLIALIKRHYFEAVVLGRDPENLALAEDRPWPATVLGAVARHYQTSNRFVCRGASVIMQPALGETH